jgi:hypothetical protein
MAKLTSNVHVVTEDDPQGTWYGPDYPDAGDPPEGAVTNPSAFEDNPHEADLRFRVDDFSGSDDEPRKTTRPEEFEGQGEGAGASEPESGAEAASAPSRRARRTSGS